MGKGLFFSFNSRNELADVNTSFYFRKMAFFKVGYDVTKYLITYIKSIHCCYIYKISTKQ